MTIVELVQSFAESPDLAVLLMDIDLEKPGPTILYDSPAFARMSGQPGSRGAGKSPRFLQGAGMSREATRMIARSLIAEGRSHGVMQDYRRSGEAYQCEIDARAILDRTGRPEAFMTFERAAVRRRGRPSWHTASRYRPPKPIEPPRSTTPRDAKGLFT